MSTTKLPILHFNDVYRVQQKSKAGTISADQFAAKIAQIRTSWGEESRALEFLEPQQKPDDDDSDSDEDADNDDPANDHTIRQRLQSDFPERSLRGLTLFSGDVFNPSIESSVTRGVHMIDVLQASSIDCACLGNHDFDFGYPHLQKLMRQTSFPWTFTNIVDVGHTDAQRGHEEEPQKNDAQVQGTLRAWTCDVQTDDAGTTVRVGCIGLVERDWIATVPAFPPSFRYRSMVATAKMLSKELRDPQGEHQCEIVIALTHCRLPNDIDLANALGATRDAPEDEHGVDLVLGGHDHTYYVGNGVDSYEGSDWKTSLPGKEKDHGCMLVKSGTDFHDLSQITLELSAPKEGVVRRRRVVSASVRRHETLPSDETLPELKEHIDKLMDRVGQATGQPVAFALTPLDCRMDRVRTEESGVGSFVADILLHSYEASLRERDRRGELDESRAEDCREVDMALICGGSLRGDEVFGPGLIALRDILTIMPFEDAVIVRLLKGRDILAALENGFGAYPSQEGRFPQVAGISVEWDSNKPPGSRVVEVRLLEDVHMFDADGKRQRQMSNGHKLSGGSTAASGSGERDGASKDGKADTNANGSNGGTESPAEGSETYAFERSQAGGYSIEVNKPRIRKGAPLQMDRVYRVATREYMADGHDGYAALQRACGPDLVDHENGGLMSTHVRNFLLGASLIWRLNAFRENSNEEGAGVVGQHHTLSTRTREAIERARRVLANGGDAQAVAETLGADDGHLAMPERDTTRRPSPLDVTAAGAERDAARRVTPGRSSAASNGSSGRRVVVDSSPGAFRDAMHVGISEHHSQYDAASQHFRDSSRRSHRHPHSAAHGGSGAGDSSVSDWSRDASSTTSESETSGEGETAASAPARFADRPFLVTSTDGDDQTSTPATAVPPTASTLHEDEGMMDTSSYFTPNAVRRHVQVTAEDGAELRAAEGNLAIIAPMRDGRIVNIAKRKQQPAAPQTAPA